MSLSKGIALSRFDTSPGLMRLKARTQIAHHVDKIVLRPVQKGDERFYVASGEWSLLGREMGPDHDPAQVKLRMVAGACNVLKLTFETTIGEAA